MQALARDGVAEEALQAVVVTPQCLQREEEMVLAWDGEVGVRDRREDVEGDGRVGGGDAVDVDDAEVRRADGWLGDHHGDVVAVPEDGLGELNHGDDVADARAGVQDDGLLLHCSEKKKRNLGGAAVVRSANGSASPEMQLISVFQLLPRRKETNGGRRRLWLSGSVMAGCSLPTSWMMHTPVSWTLGRSQDVRPQHTTHDTTPRFKFTL